MASHPAALNYRPVVSPYAQATLGGSDKSSSVARSVRPTEVNTDDFVAFFDTMTRSAEAAYAQSHPLDTMYTAKDLATDQVTLSSNFMKQIFGGRPTPMDSQHKAYAHAWKQFAEAPVTQENTLGLQDEIDFVPGQENVTTQALLDSFAQARRYYDKRIDTDAERALKSRSTHRQTHTTYYGKNHGRFHNIIFQTGEALLPPDTSRFRPAERLSSRTGAPQPDGTHVPLRYNLVADADPREVPVTREPRYLPSEAGINGGNDLGNYYGAEIDTIFTAYNDDPKDIKQLFMQKPRS